jgi:hypothetical protein
MKEQEVKKIIGYNNWNIFLEWMRGQTMGIYEDGSTNYYDCDVYAFKEKIDTEYDRQTDPNSWD